MPAETIVFEDAVGEGLPDQQVRNGGARQYHGFYLRGATCESLPELDWQHTASPTSSAPGTIIFIAKAPLACDG